MNIASVAQAIATLSWLLVIGAVVLVVVRASRGQRMAGGTTLILVTVLLAAVLNTVSAGLVFIQPQERGVVISALDPNGIRDRALQPGLRWIIPFFEHVERYPISKQTYTMSIAPLEGSVQGDDSVAARTSDGQEIFIDASVIFAVNPSDVVDLHITWQDRYIDGLVRPLARGVIRDAVSQFRVDEVYSARRFDLNRLIVESLGERLSQNGLSLAEFVLRNITFTPEYAASVEQKQIAEQRALEAAFVVQQREQEAQQAREVARGESDAVVIRAEGDAEARLIQADAEARALRLIADALRENPDLLTFEYIDKLSPGIQVMLVPSENPFLLPLPALENQVETPALSVTPSPTPTAVPSPTPTEEGQ